MVNFWPKICIAFFIYANLERLKRKISINLLNYFVNKYHPFLADNQESLYFKLDW